MSDCISYNIPYSPPNERMILSAPENMYGHKVHKSFLQSGVSHVTICNQSGLDKEDYVDACGDVPIQLRSSRSFHAPFT